MIRSGVKIASSEQPSTSLLGEITSLIGENAARGLVASFGGRRVYVPRSPAIGDRMVRTIGLAAALKLADAFGAERLFIPLDARRPGRRAQIRELRARGDSVSSIARSLHVTERYIYKVLAHGKD